MRLKYAVRSQRRAGTVVILVALLLVPFLGLCAFAIDYGYILLVRTELQRVADSASLAGVAHLAVGSNETISSELGADEFLAAQRALFAVKARAARNEAVNFANLHNSSGGIDSIVVDGQADVEVGRLETDERGAPVLDGNGVPRINPDRYPYDTVRVVVRRDGATNNAISLFFANVLGIGETTLVAIASARIQRGEVILPGTKVIPFALHEDAWAEALQTGQTVLYSDSGNERGNFGTLDLGSQNNSTPDIARQIDDGPNEWDFEQLDQLGLLNNTGALEAPVTLQGDPGLSVGRNVRGNFQDLIGRQRIIPIYDERIDSGGNTTQYHVTGWVVVTIVAEDLVGNPKRLTISPDYIFDANVRPNPNPDAVTATLNDGIYVAPSLIE